MSGCDTQRFRPCVRFCFDPHAPHLHAVVRGHREKSFLLCRYSSRHVNACCGRLQRDLHQRTGPPHVRALSSLWTRQGFCKAAFWVSLFSMSAIAALSSRPLAPNRAELSLSSGSHCRFGEWNANLNLTAGHSWAKLRVYMRLLSEEQTSLPGVAAGSHHGGSCPRAQIRTLMQRNLRACADFLIGVSRVAKKAHNAYGWAFGICTHVAAQLARMPLTRSLSQLAKHPAAMRRQAQYRM